MKITTTGSAGSPVQQRKARSGQPMTGRAGGGSGHKAAVRTMLRVSTSVAMSFPTATLSVLPEMQYARLSFLILDL